jgi:hypothetical protein
MTVSEQCQCGINKMSVFTFNTSLLLMCMRTRETMSNTNRLKICTKVTILTTLVRLNSYNFMIKETFNRDLKLKKGGHDIRFCLNRKNPCISTENINERNIISISIN